MHVITPGGSDPYGTLGYVNAVLELSDQLAAMDRAVPANIVVAAGTMGTAAGIAIGAELLGWDTTISAIRITSRQVTNEGAMNRLVRGTCDLLRKHGLNIDERGASARIRLVHSQVGMGYGKTTAAADAALARFQERGIELDVTYTAKAAAELLARDSDSTVLYWHTLSGMMPRMPTVDTATLPRKFREYLETSH